MMVGVGTLMTLDLPEGAPALTMPWIITFGPLDDDEDWEPVVVGPYERQHALAIAEEVVADEDLMAVVEPLVPHTSVQDIRAEIALAIAAGAAVEDEEEFDEGDEPDDDEILEEAGGVQPAPDVVEVAPEEHQRAAGPPSPEEIRAGFARIAARLTAQE